MIYDDSHFHWDHTGDPSTFPASTALIVGPGFRETYIPSYPTNPDSPIKESDYAGRELREIEFSYPGALTIGRFPACDFFGDGSFFLLDSPGHAIGHMCGLARTTAGTPGANDTFIFMGGDACHHGGEFRPTAYRPLPPEISPNPLDPGSGKPCSGELFEAIHRHQSGSEPFFEVAVLGDGKGVAHDAEEATRTIRKLEAFDACPDVFVVIAHDDAILDVVDVFPRDANGWKVKGWAEKVRWAFLRDFKKAVDRVRGE